MNSITTIKLKWISVPRKTIEPCDMQTGDIELWSIPDYDKGMPSITRREDIGSSKKIVYPGDILLSKIVPHIRRAWIVDARSNLPKYASTEWLTFNSNKVLPAYLRYVFLTDEFNKQMQLNSSGMGSLRRSNPEKIGNISIPLPTLEMQKAIASKLDERSEKIKKLIKIKDEVLSKLLDYRKSLITHAVTNGLNPDVRMIDSGVHDFDIPEHWTCTSLWQVIHKIGDVDHYMPKDANKGDSSVPYVMTRNLAPLASQIDFDSCKQISKEDFLQLSKKITATKGDVILARYATVGTSCFVDVIKDFVPSYSCVIIKPQKKVLGTFINYFFNSSLFSYQARLLSRTNTQDNLGIETIQKIKIAFPPINEQEEIVEHLDKKCGVIHKAEISIENEISALKEYQSNLISSFISASC